MCTFTFDAKNTALRVTRIKPDFISYTCLLKISYIQISSEHSC